MVDCKRKCHMTISQASISKFPLKSVVADLRAAHLDVIIRNKYIGMCIHVYTVTVDEQREVMNTRY